MRILSSLSSLCKSWLEYVQFRWRLFLIQQSDKDLLLHLHSFTQHVQAGCAGQYAVRVSGIVKAYMCLACVQERGSISDKIPVHPLPKRNLAMV